jgi:cobalt-precorrin 5A hydrolase
MKIAVVAVSQRGAALALRLQNAWKQNLSASDNEWQPDAPACALYALEKYAQASPAFTPFVKASVLVTELWGEVDGIVFLCASGIAVRAIAPLVKSKFTDPAVVVTGDAGAFAISLLSGHEGGANRLAEFIATTINATANGDTTTGCLPVITTASECSPAVTPRNLFVGVGSTKGITTKRVVEAVRTLCAKHNLSPMRIRAFCTIELKRDEPGILEAAEVFDAPLLWYSAGELAAVAGEFNASEYVQRITGVDNVCERAAMCAAGAAARLVVPKTAGDGLTLAVAAKMRICFP